MIIAQGQVATAGLLVLWTPFGGAIPIETEIYVGITFCTPQIGGVVGVMPQYSGIIIRK